MGNAARISSAAVAAMTHEPMVRVLERALTDVAANDGQIDSGIAVALGNAGLQKKVCATLQVMNDPTGHSRAHFEEQSDAYGKLGTELKQRGLIAGISPDTPNRTRG